ncbi:TPA: hypothetical protein ACPVZG_000498 [Vibrio parahaemolyticus]
MKNFSITICTSNATTYAADYSNLIERTLGMNGFAQMYGLENGNNKYMVCNLYAVLDSRDMETGNISVDLTFDGFRKAVFVTGDRNPEYNTRLMKSLEEKYGNLEENNIAVHYFNDATVLDAAHGYLDALQINDRFREGDSLTDLAVCRFFHGLYGRTLSKEKSEINTDFTALVAKEFFDNELDIALFNRSVGNAHILGFFNEEGFRSSEAYETFSKSKTVMDSGLESSLSHVVLMSEVQGDQVNAHVEIYIKDRGLVFSGQVSNPFAFSQVARSLGINHSW